VSPRRSALLAFALTLGASAPLHAQAASLDAGPDVPTAPASLAPALLAPASPTPAALAAPVAGPVAATASDAPAAVGPARTLTAAAARSARLGTASLDQEQAALQARARNSFSQSQVLMIVGGAALITGLVIGDDVGDILAIGGAGVGLYGLYRYLQGR
jgi:hypothetical protein